MRPWKGACVLFLKQPRINFLTQNKVQLAKSGGGKGGIFAWVDEILAKEVTRAVRGEPTGDTSFAQRALGFLRDWSHLTRKFALEPVAFPFSSLCDPSSVAFSLQLKPSRLFIEQEQFYHRVWCLI